MKYTVGENKLKKSLYKLDMDSSKGPQEKIEIQRKALRQTKNLAIGEHSRLEK